MPSLPFFNNQEGDVIGWGDLVHYVGGGVAQHALGADIEYLNDASLVVAILKKLALLKIAFCKAPFSAEPLRGGPR